MVCLHYRPSEEVLVDFFSIIGIVSLGCFNRRPRMSSIPLLICLRPWR
jgi:hypothetical protein